MKAEFDAIKESLDEFDKEREVVIKESRGILKNAKQAIYALHRGEIADAKRLLADALKIKDALEKKVANN
ncbi:hypothetical protein GOV10_04945, partial [Candidatus Woesearchaeota archaeon]|nr:hypothetical protein [Candidatus Woesearchaeota archaeon]